jgi:hypothetical protein
MRVPARPAEVASARCGEVAGPSPPSRRRSGEVCEVVHATAQPAQPKWAARRGEGAWPSPHSEHVPKTHCTRGTNPTLGCPNPPGFNNRKICT